MKSSSLTHAQISVSLSELALQSSSGLGLSTSSNSVVASDSYVALKSLHTVYLTKEIFWDDRSCEPLRSI